MGGSLLYQQRGFGDIEILLDFGGRRNVAALVVAFFALARGFGVFLAAQMHHQRFLFAAAVFVAVFAFLAAGFAVVCSGGFRCSIFRLLGGRRRGLDVGFGRTLVLLALVLAFGLGLALLARRFGLLAACVVAAVGFGGVAFVVGTLVAFSFGFFNFLLGVFAFGAAWFAAAVGTLARGLRLVALGGGFVCFGAAAEQAAQPVFQAAQQRGLGHRCRRGVFEAFDGGFGAGGFFAFLAGKGHAVAVFRLADTLVAGFGIVVHVVSAHAGDFVVRVFQAGVGNQENGNVQPLFHAEEFGAFFVEQEGGDINRHLHVHFAGVVFHGGILNQAQNVQGGGFDAADDAGAGAARAGDVAGLAERGFEPLAGKFEQAEFGKFAHLHAGAVFFQGVAQGVFDFALVLGVFHVDKVNDHQSAQVAQAHLAGDFFGGFHIGFEGGLFDVGTAGGAGGVDVDGHQRFGVVDNDGAAAGQVYRAGKGGFDLLLDLQAGKQRGVVFVELESAEIGGHHVAHKLEYLLVNFAVVDQDFADVGAVVVADGADQQRAFHKQQIGLAVGGGGFFDGLPQLQQVVEIPL